MSYSYTPRGTCSSKIEFDLDDANKIHNLKVTDGCNGNLKGIASLVEGMDAQTVIDRFDGIRCGFKNTSCPDQISKALKKALSEKTR